MYQQAVEMVYPGIEAILCIFKQVGDNGKWMIVAHHRVINTEYILNTLRRIVLNKLVTGYITKVIPVGKLIDKGILIK